MHHFLRIHCKLMGISLQLVELDILRNAKVNFALDKVRDFWLMKIKAKHFDLVISSPPCSTFSRAPWANLWGPRPIRSQMFPRGFTWLKWSQKRLAELGNTLADFSFEALLQQVQLGGLIIKEQPEDLGAVRSGPWAGRRPASMWQFKGHSDLLQHTGCKSVAIFQSDFGAQYPKPTRLLLNLPLLEGATFYEGLPVFDDQGFYKGPLPKCTTATSSLRRSSSSSPFTTTGTAAWPPKLCAWLACCAVKSFIQTRSTVLKKREELVPGSVETPEPLPFNGSSPGSHDPTGPGLLPDDPLRSLGRDSCEGGLGPARTCKSPGKTHMFHDGATLLSPGRWCKENRNLPCKPAWQNLRSSLDSLLEADLSDSGGLSKRCFQLAKVKTKPCSAECLANIAKALENGW